MSAFANVFVGNTANDGTGDTLRTAFQKIDQNFANIALVNATSPVMSVAGRKGNIVLSVNDVQGAASIGYVTVQTDAANIRTDSSISSALTNISTLVTAANTAARAYTDSSIASANIIVGNLSTLSANIGRIYANLGLLTQEVGNIGFNTTSGWLGSINYGIGFLSNSATWSNIQLSTLSNSITAVNSAVVANASTLGNTITAANTAVNSRVTDINSALLTTIGTANTGMKSYVDGQVTTLVANDTVQSNALNSINANLGTVTINISSLTANAIAQQSDIISVRQAGNVNASAILTANINVVNFVNDLNSAVIARVNAANTAIVTANTSLKSYTDTAISTAINNLVNSAPGTLDTLNEIAANLANEGSAINGLLSAVTLANSAILSLTTNAAGQANQITGANTAIVTANTGMKSYVDSIVTSLTANDTVQSSQIIGANAAIVTANTGMKSYVDSAVSTLTANAAVQEMEVSGLRANITAANTIVTSVVGVFNTFSNVVTGNISNLETAVSYTNSNIITANANVVSYVNTLNSVMSGRLNAANVNIATNKATIDQINTSITALTANVTTGFISVTGNITAGNLRTGGAVTATNGIIFADGSHQTTAAGSTALGNIAFSGYNITNNGDDSGYNGITITPANGGEIHLKSYTGVNNTNPGYWVHVGDGSIGAPRNTGNIAVDFYGNDSVRGSLVWDYDWSANTGSSNIGTNTSIPGHVNFGLYRNGLYQLPMMVFDYASGNVTLGNTSVNKLTTTTGVFWPNGQAYSTGGGVGGYGNAQVASYLANYDGGINFTASPAVITGLGNISSANFTFANGVNILSTIAVGSTYSNANVAAYLVANPQTGTYSNANINSYLTAGVSGNIKTSSNVVAPNYLFANGVNILSTIAPSSTYSNTNVAAYISTDPTITVLQANVGSFYTYANATYSTGSGSTYSNANVVSMLAANTAVFVGNVGVIGNVATGNIQANATAIFLGGNTVISNYGSPTFGYATHIGNNIYFDANGVMRYRNTQTGASDLLVSPGSLNFYATSGAVTANTATGYTGATSLYMGLSTSGMSLYNGAGLVSSGAVTIQSATGLVTNQATIAVFNGVGSTINMGGVATTITLGQSTPGTSSNIFIGNTIGTQTGNLTLRARGQYNYTTQSGVAGGYNSPPYVNQTLTGGSGTGMTATYSSTGGYVSFPITIVNPGTGYKNGDVLTLPGGGGTTAQIWNYNSNYVGQTGQSDLTLTIDGNLILPGNLSVPGTTTLTGNLGINGGAVTIYDSILDLHTYANAAVWSSDDGKDIGLRMHYYNGVDSLAFLGLENSTKTLQYIADATEVAGNVTGTFGNVQMGSLLLSNTTASTSYTTGALTVAGGAGVAGNLTVAGNITQQSAYYETYGNISNTGGNLTCNFNLGTTFYAALTANVTANFTNVNAVTSTVSGATIIVDQGSTAYRIANVQVNGVNQTVKWVGATAGAGTASNTDVMSFSLINLGGGVYRVLGQISNYG